MAYPDRLDCALFLLLPPAFWLGVWQLGAWLVELHVEGRGNELLLPYPVTVLMALLRLARSPEFWWTALASLARVAAGMAGGAALGVLLAALACASPWCRRLFAPVIRIIRAWKSGVAAEVLCLPRLGIGAQISRAKQAFETADLFAWTAAVILLSLLMERALTRLIRHPEGGSGL